MTAKNLSTVAAGLIESYGNTARNLIDACRAGNERAIEVMEQRWDDAIRLTPAGVPAETAHNAAAAHLMFSVYYTKAVMLAANGAQHAVSQLVKLAGAGVERAAASADAFEEKTGTTALSAMARAAAPAAVLLGNLSALVEEKTGQLADRIAGDGIATVRVKRSSPFSQRRAADAA